MLLASLFVIHALGGGQSHTEDQWPGQWEPGKYIVTQLARIRKAPELSSDLIGEKHPEDVVMLTSLRLVNLLDYSGNVVLENNIPVQVLRGRIAQGWITVAESQSGKTWLRKADDVEEDSPREPAPKFTPMEPTPVRRSQSMIPSGSGDVTVNRILKRQIQCPEGHDVLFTDGSNLRNKFRRCNQQCDGICKTCINVAKTGVYRCDDCDYDVCIACSETFAMEQDLSQTPSAGWPSDKGEICSKKDVDLSLPTNPAGFREGSIKDGFKSLKVPHIEAWSDVGRKIYKPQGHGFVDAIYHAFDRHIPLAFGPDDIWQLIIQGVIKHIDNQPQQVRNMLGIYWEGQETLRVRRNDFVKGSPKNDWASTFEDFNHQIQNTLGKSYDVLMAEFSSTNNVQKAVHQVAAMASVKNYFKFLVQTDCGISKIKLLGSEADWIKLQTKVQKLKSQFKLGWWLDHVDPILEKIILTYRGELKGRESKEFWYTIYKQFSTTGSEGATWVSGWITNFFPYADDMSDGNVVTKQRSKFANLEQLRLDRNDKEISIDIQKVPNGVAKTPFQWVYHGQPLKMNLYGGFAGFRIDEEKYIRPVLGWAVGEDQ